MNSIISLKNPKIKFLTQLKEKSRTRKKEELFIIEGQREIQLAIQGKYIINEIYYCSEYISNQEVNDLIDSTTNPSITEISIEVYQKLAYRQTTEGIIAVAKTKSLALHDLNIKNNNPLILVAEAPEKPGNIGALLRTADAANIDAVLIANPKTDLYNPNIIRSSVGCIFTNKIAMGTTKEIINYLQDSKIAIYAATLQASVPYHTINYNKASAIVVGTEATGLNAEWREQSTQNIIIPMQGIIDSMNVSVAAGILIYEAKRQRGFI